MSLSSRANDGQAALATFVRELEKRKIANLAVCDRIVQRVAIDCLESVQVGSTVTGSPGTPRTTGWAASHWHVGINDASMPAAGEPPKGGTFDPSGSLQNGITQLLEMKVGDIAYLLNPVRYMWRLEYGWSTKAPSGFLRLTLAAAKELLARAVAVETGRAAA